MRKILWDNINKKEVTKQYFFDQYGDCYINEDPFGVSMDGKITIKQLSKDHIQYEVREVEN